MLHAIVTPVRRRAFMHVWRGFETVTMVFQNRMMGSAMDRFGGDIAAMKENSSHFRVSVSAAVRQQFFVWVFGLETAVQIVAPESVKKQMKKVRSLRREA